MDDDGQPDGQQDQPERTHGSWTIKEFDLKVRDSANTQAAARGEPMRVWLAQAVADRIAKEKGEQVIPPDQRGTTGTTPAIQRVAVSGDVADMLRAVAQFMAAPGTSRAALGEANATGRALLRAVRGAPPEPARHPPQRRITQGHPENGGSQPHGTTQDVNGMTGQVAG